MKRMIALSLMVTLCCSVAVAQSGRGRPGQGGRTGGGGGSKPGTAGSATLENAGLKLGQTLPDLTVFDEKGEKFRLADVKGKHTVIVFGCLT